MSVVISLFNILGCPISLKLGIEIKLLWQFNIPVDKKFRKINSKLKNIAISADIMFAITFGEEVKKEKCLFYLE